MTHKTKKIKIKYVNHGLANVINGEIEINKELLKKPELYKKILRHEKEHIKGDDYVDFREKLDSDILFFVLKTPSTWSHFLPLWIRGNTIIYSKTMMILWLLCLYLFISIIFSVLYPWVGFCMAVFFPFLALGLLKWFW